MSQSPRRQWLPHCLGIQEFFNKKRTQDFLRNIGPHKPKKLLCQTLLRWSSLKRSSDKMHKHATCTCVCKHTFRKEPKKLKLEWKQKGKTRKWGKMRNVIKLKWEGERKNFKRPEKGSIKEKVSLLLEYIAPTFYKNYIQSLAKNVKILNCDWLPPAWEVFLEELTFLCWWQPRTRTEWKDTLWSLHVTLM